MRLKTLRRVRHLDWFLAIIFGVLAAMITSFFCVVFNWPYPIGVAIVVGVVVYWLAYMCLQPVETVKIEEINEKWPDDWDGA